MDIRKLQRVIVDALEDVKAQDIVVYNTKHLTSEFERVIIASGSSNRQTRALGYNVSHEVKQAGGEVLGLEGTDTGEWVLVDCGAAIVHILQPAMREYYNLEEVWGGKRVNIKLSSDKKSVESPSEEKPKSHRPRAVRGKTIRIVEDWHNLSLFLKVQALSLRFSLLWKLQW